MKLKKGKCNLLPTEMKSILRDKDHSFPISNIVDMYIISGDFPVRTGKPLMSGEVHSSALTLWDAPNPRYLIVFLFLFNIHMSWMSQVLCQPGIGIIRTPTDRLRHNHSKNQVM